MMRSKSPHPFERIFVAFLGSWLLEETIYSLSLYRFPWGMFQADLYILHPDGALNMYVAPRFYKDDDDAIEHEGELLAGYVKTLGYDPEKAIRLQETSYVPPAILPAPAEPSSSVVEMEAWFLTRRALEKAAG